MAAGEVVVALAAVEEVVDEEEVDVEEDEDEVEELL